MVFMKLFYFVHQSAVKLPFIDQLALLQILTAVVIFDAVSI